MNSLIDYARFMKAAANLGIENFTDHDDIVYERREYNDRHWFTIPGLGMTLHIGSDLTDGHPGEF